MVIGLFIARRQLGNLAARKLDERLAAAGFYLTWDSADWVQRNGIKVNGLALFRDAAKKDRLAFLGNLTVVRGNTEWDRWDTFKLSIADASLTLGSGAAETELEAMGMDMNIMPGRLDLVECHATMQGLRIEAKGEHVFQSSSLGAPSESAKPVAERIAGLNLDWLTSVKSWVNFLPEKEKPVLKLEFHPRANSNCVDLTAALAGRMFQWHGQKWDSVQATAKTTLGEKDSPIVIDHLRVGHGNRTGEMSGSYDPAHKVIRIGKLDSGIDFLALMRKLEPDAVESLAAFTSRGNWRLTGEGEFHLSQPTGNRWNGQTALEGQLTYQSEGYHIEFQNPAFDLRFENNAFTFGDVRAGLWGGILDMPQFRIHLPSGKTGSRFDVQLTLDDARMESVMGCFKPPEKQPGIVRFGWKGGGGFARDAISGSGTLAIREAEFYRIPLLGPMSLIFGQLAPGFGRDVATSLTSHHRVSGGKLYIENMDVQSTLTHVEAKGMIDLNRQYAHLTAKAKLRGIAGLATALMSEFLEMKGEGPVDDVRWKLDHLPGSRVLEGTGTMLEKTGKAAKDIFNFPGKLLPRK